MDPIDAVNIWSPVNINCHFTRSLVNITCNLKVKLDELLAVGSYSPNNKKTELYNFGSGSWKAVKDYPFTSGPRITDYDMVYIPEVLAFLVIGGYDGFSLSQIGKLKDGQWSDAGKLNTARRVSFCSFSS